MNIQWTSHYLASTGHPQSANDTENNAVIVLGSKFINFFSYNMNYLKATLIMKNSGKLNNTKAKFYTRDNLLHYF